MVLPYRELNKTNSPVSGFSDAMLYLDGFMQGNLLRVLPRKTRPADGRMAASRVGHARLRCASLWAGYRCTGEHRCDDQDGQVGGTRSWTLAKPVARPSVPNPPLKPRVPRHVGGYVDMSCVGSPRCTIPLRGVLIFRRFSFGLRQPVAY